MLWKKIRLDKRRYRPLKPFDTYKKPTKDWRFYARYIGLGIFVASIITLIMYYR